MTKDYRKYLKAREALMNGMTEYMVAKKFRMREELVPMIALLEVGMPKKRCSGCGGKVVMPCRLCSVREKSKK
jgi:hypothetical protein